MSNPNENNNPVVNNKEKANKEFAHENESPQKENINAESVYRFRGVKPVSVNSEEAKEKTSSSLDWADVKKKEAIILARAKYGADPKLAKTKPSTQSTPARPEKANLSGAMVVASGKRATDVASGKGEMVDPALNKPKLKGLPGESIVSAAKDYVPKAPEEVSSPKVDGISEEKDTTEKDSKKEEVGSGENPEGSGDSPNKAPKKEKKIAVSGKLKEVFDIMNGGSSAEEDEKMSTGSADKKGAEIVKKTKEDIAAQKTNKDSAMNQSTSQSTTGEASGGTANTGSISKEEGEEKKDAAAKSLGDFTLETVDGEAEANTQQDLNRKKGKTQGLLVGRSMGYGAMIQIGEDKKLSVSKFSKSDDPKEEEAAKNQYNHKNDAEAKSMEEFGTPDKKEGIPMKGYYDAYIQGYNEGHREGTDLKAEAAGAERGAKMKEEQGTQEYQAGASLGMTCGILTAKGEKQVDTKFSIKKEKETQEVVVKTTVAELDSAAFDRQQTPGGELSGPAYEKAFLVYYNMGYKQAEQQRNQPPPMDKDYKLGYQQGYKLGSQKGNGEKGDADLLVIEATQDAKDQQTLKKEELQAYRGFYAGYNQGYAQVQKAKKSKVQTEREAKYKKPNFVAGYSTGNLKGFLTAMIEPSGIDLLSALNDPKKMEAAGIPSFFPIPDSLRESIKDTLIYGEVADNANESNEGKALLGKPLFKEGLLMGYNQGYLQGQNSRATFKRDKHKMHPDYQRSTLVLMASKDSSYKGPTEEGGIVKGFTMGQILANAKFEYNELIVKDSRTAEEEKRFVDLSKAIAAINGIIGKENKYYQLGIDEFFNWWLDILGKKARNKKVNEGYSGGEGTTKREGFDWGRKVGDKVISVKEELKGIKRRGHDITARSKKLNATIQKTDAKAKATSKNKGGEDYYIGYRNGYNHSFRLAKEGKKSDSGNLDTGDVLEKAGNKGAKYITLIWKVLEELGLSSISEDEFSPAIQTAKGSFSKETEKAFKDGLSIGYNSGYSATVVDIKTGKPTTSSKTDKAKIKDQYRIYEKLKDGHKKNIAYGLLYFFLVGYQYDKKDETDGKAKYGLPKGISDADSFNAGYFDAKGGKGKGSEMGSSKDAYLAGYNGANHQDQYALFKEQMIAASLGNKATGEQVTDADDEKNVSKGTADEFSKKESSVDQSMLSGIALLAKDETTEVIEDEKLLQSAFYQEGKDNAAKSWKKIFYLSKGVYLDDSPITIKFLGGKEPIIIADEQMAKESYSNKDAIIKELAANYIETKFTWKSFISNFASEYSSWGEAWDSYSIEVEKEKQNYIKGYDFQIQFIEKGYEGKFTDNWLYDSGYHAGITKVATDIELDTPSKPYQKMNLDTSSSYYKEGFLEGIKKGVLIKNGVIQPNARDLGKITGADGGKGYEDGQKKGTADGVSDAEKKEFPSDDSIKEKFKKNNKIQDSGYKRAYLDAYLTFYWANRNYEYGRLLGYKRGGLGGDSVFNSDPEKGVIIKDENAFFQGFEKGREMGVTGVSEDVFLGKGKKDKAPENPKEVIQKITSKYAQRNAAIQAIHELNLEEAIKKIKSKKDLFYKPYGELKAIKALGIADRDQKELFQRDKIKSPFIVSQYLTEGFQTYLNISFMGLSAEERSIHLNTFKINYKNAHTIALADSLSELTTFAMNDHKHVTTSGIFDEIDSGLDEAGDTALDVLKKLLIGDTQEFYLKDLVLLKMFYALETRIDNLEDKLEDNLEDIEFHRTVSELLDRNDQAADLEEIAMLESELKDKSLKNKDIKKKKNRIRALKKENKKEEAEMKKTKADWVKAETAAKKKIDSIRLLMKNRLAFDAPIESNEDILNQIKINLESSKGNNEVIYNDLDIFNDLVLNGDFSYQENDEANVSISGNTDFHLDNYAKNVYIEDSDVFMEKNGFEFKSKGFSYVQHDTLTFMEGSFVTPSIEGGEHNGSKYKYDFGQFRVRLNQGVKAQIEAQKNNLEGGSV